MRIGVVILPQERWSVSRQHWLEAEQLGFDHAWTYDHLAWRSLADQPWFATVPLLAAAGAVTSTIGLGTWVASPNFRHPVPFAKDVMGLDDVTGGRLLLGLGAGGEGFDARVLGPAPTRGERTSRFEEFVELLDTLLTQSVTDHTGRWYTATDARMVPGTIARLGHRSWSRRTVRAPWRSRRGTGRAGRRTGRWCRTGRARVPRTSGGRVWRSSRRRTTRSRRPRGTASPHAGT
ncbi:LLM class flavin-dependent oxidoreductase [Cellulomonas sp. 73-145]|uniref:LLM class flavin-dependent oxidoreductase n=1 Tax=Cellulomonas sp. 73-145 TaxID=1895739 RepID=UPI000AAE8353